MNTDKTTCPDHDLLNITLLVDADHVTVDDNTVIFKKGDDTVKYVLRIRNYRMQLDVYFNDRGWHTGQEATPEHPGTVYPAMVDFFEAARQQERTNRIKAQAGFVDAAKSFFADYPA